MQIQIQNSINHMNFKNNIQTIYCMDKHNDKRSNNIIYIPLNKKSIKIFMKHHILFLF